MAGSPYSAFFNIFLTFFNRFSNELLRLKVGARGIRESKLSLFGSKGSRLRRDPLDFSDLNFSKAGGSGGPLGPPGVA